MLLLPPSPWQENAQGEGRDMNNPAENLIRLNGISKSFYGVEVLKDIDLEFKTGEVHVVCGENGAGKSTLMKIIAGLYKPSRGTMSIDGQAAVFASTNDSEKAGIAIVYQELSLCPTTSIAENIFLNREYGKIFIDKQKMAANAKVYLDYIGLKVNPNILVQQLSIAEMQMVQIAKALSQNAKFIILDEPCSSLTQDESNTLFALMRNLKEKGVGFIYIDHRIENIQKIADKVTVLRDGLFVGTLDGSQADRDTIINMMVGRQLSQLFSKTGIPLGRELVRVENISNRRIHDVSFSVRAGEVFGLGGMVGAGRSEIIRAIFGADSIESNGKIVIDGKVIKRNSPIKSIRNGIGYVPEDRKLQSLVVKKNPVFNILLAFFDLINKGAFINDKKGSQAAQKQIDSLRIKISARNMEVAELSGGNQQKVVLAKWLLNHNLKVLLLDEPTRGVDVGVKAEIYRLINDLAIKGVAIVLVTSELPELIGLSDRIAVIKNGSIAGILEKEDFTQEKVMNLGI